MVDCQSLCQSDGSFVPKLVATKTTDKKDNTMDALRKGQILNLDYQYVTQLKALW